MPPQRLPLNVDLFLLPPSLDTRLWLGTLMSQAPTGRDDDQIELAVRFRDLRISIFGPADQATGLLQQITRLRDQPLPVVRTLSPTPTEASFDFVPFVVAEELPTSSHRLPGPVETRDQILSSFEDCPAHFFGQARRLVGSITSGAERGKRAWVAGQWAKAVVAKRVHSPNRTTPLDIRSRFSAVVRAERVQSPTLFLSSGSYWAKIGDLSRALPSPSPFRVSLGPRSILLEKLEIPAPLSSFLKTKTLNPIRV